MAFNLMYFNFISEQSPKQYLTNLTTIHDRYTIQFLKIDDNNSYFNLILILAQEY